MIVSILLKELEDGISERYIKEYKDYYDKEKKINVMRKEMTKKTKLVDNEYDKYFILDGKKT